MDKIATQLYCYMILICCSIISVSLFIQRRHFRVFIIFFRYVASNITKAQNIILVSKYQNILTQDPHWEFYIICQQIRQMENH